MAPKGNPKKKPAKAMPKETGLVPKGYEKFLGELKERIRRAQLKAAVSVNRELIELYWQIGKALVERQKAEGWGKAVIDRLGDDLQKAFPGLAGFSRTNVYRMRAFYLAYAETPEIVPQAVGQTAEAGPPKAATNIPWGHNVVLLEQVKDPEERLWYAHAAVQHGWSRNVLVHWIESDLYGRQGKAQTNFERTLATLQSDLARETLKDPYNFDFLTLSGEAEERELERGLVDHIRQFLLELGTGFAFVGQQFPLKVGGEDLPGPRRRPGGYPAVTHNASCAAPAPASRPAPRRHHRGRRCPVPAPG